MDEMEKDEKLVGVREEDEENVVRPSGNVGTWEESSGGEGRRSCALSNEILQLRKWHKLVSVETLSSCFHSDGKRLVNTRHTLWQTSAFFFLPLTADVL